MPATFYVLKTREEAERVFDPKAVLFSLGGEGNHRPTPFGWTTLPAATAMAGTVNVPVHDERLKYVVVEVRFDGEGGIEEALSAEGVALPSQPSCLEMGGDVLLFTADAYPVLNRICRPAAVHELPN